jgi:hypothetical protein
MLKWAQNRPCHIRTATLVLSHKEYMSDIHTGICNCSLSSFTWNNYFFYIPTDRLSPNNSEIWSVKLNFPSLEHWNCNDLKWQDNGKIDVWALNAARYLNRNYTWQSGLTFEQLWCYLLNNKHYSHSGGHKRIKQHQGIFLENGTHTICTVWQCTDIQVYSYMINYRSLQLS